MWGNKKKQVQTSEFFKGFNIFDKLTDSIFGRIKQTFEEIFTKQDIDQYTLPKVIVIGNESTGKSSLLENLTKCQLFPRDSKLCTKCPIHVKLTHGVCKYIVQCPTENNEFKTIEVKNKNEIYGVVNEYMKNLPVDYISESEILIDITDCDVPTFEFYDLPGIRTYPPESAEMTIKLCKKYLSDKNSIVLCVVPATTPRLTSCQSIALISEMKMEHNCILALTMADKLQSDDIEELLIKRIIGTSDELNGLNFAGYIAVVNRVHSDSHSLEENDVNEIKWFNENILEYIPNEYNKYEQQIIDNITITNLITRMNELYNEFIHRDWKPRILASIDVRINELKSKYMALGCKKVDPIEINNVIEKFINNMYTSVHKSCHTMIQSFDELFEVNENVEKIIVDNMKATSVDTSAKKAGKPKVAKSAAKKAAGGAKPKATKGEQEKPPTSTVATTALVTVSVVDAADNKNENNCYIRYYECIKSINTDVQNYANFNISYIERIIEDYFKHEKDYKIERFIKIKKNLIDKMKINFNNLVQENIKKVRKSVENCIMSHYLGDCVQPTYHSEVFKMYKLLVLYPLFSMKINYNARDYVESDDYQQKRKDLLELITKTQKHYESIIILPDMNQNKEISPGGPVKEPNIWGDSDY